MDDGLEEMIKIGCISVAILVFLVICIWSFKHLPQKQEIAKGSINELIQDFRSLRER